MYIPKKLKLNQFRVVQIPSAKEIINRFGFASGSHFSGDQSVPPPMSKTDMMAAVDEMDIRAKKLEEINSDYENNKDIL